MTTVKNTRMYTAPVPKMPPGLVELMEGLAKDVLKCNPPDIYSFCANHMMKLIEIRDGPIPKREMTLEEKIAVANKKIRQRAEQRCKDYDLEMKIKSASQNIGAHEKIPSDKNNSEIRRYLKENIVIIPEKDLVGAVEHEIFVDKKENITLSESAKSAEKDTENTLEAIHSDENATSTALLEDFIKTNDGELSMIYVADNFDNDENIEMLQDNALEHKMESLQLDQNAEKFVCIPDDEEKYLESVAKTENDVNIQNFDTITKNEDNLECEALHIKNDNQEKSNTEADIQQSKSDLKNSNSNEGHKEEIAGIDHSNMANTDNIDETTNDDGNTMNGIYNNPDGQICLESHENQDDKSTDNLLADDTEVLNDSKVVVISDINNSPMDLETAAITIQKVFRNFLFKNKTLSSDDATNIDINSLIEDKNEKSENDDILGSNIGKDRRTLGLSRIDTVLQTVNEEKSLSQSTDDSSTLSSAATIIQAHVRGFLIRNKYNLNKNSSTTSGVDSDGLSLTSIEGDNDNRKNKTILNIHIVPENGHFISRDESVLTSTDLSLDGSPPDSGNLHLGYERNERRKQLRREDAVQSISPPSNNSGKSEDIESVKELVINKENNKDECSFQVESDHTMTDAKEIVSAAVSDLSDANISTMVGNLDTALEVKSLGPIDSPVKYDITARPHSLPELTSDEMDVVTPFTPSEDKHLNDANLIHSSEFHEVVLPTKVARSDASVVRGE